MESTNISGNQEKSQPSNIIVLDTDQKMAIRNNLIESARNLLGIPYKFGAEWENHSAIPMFLDCSEMVEGIFMKNGLKMEDGTQNQFNCTSPTGTPQIGDLAFFGRGQRPTQVYHVGMIFDTLNIIEARAFDPAASFETGKVILRPQARWVAYKDFLGFRSHVKL